MFYSWTHGEMPCYMYKSEFDKVRLLRWIFKTFHAIPVRRGDADLTSTKITIDRLEKGHNVCVFPEGHRNPATNCLLEFRKGAALYALKSKCPIRLFYIWDQTKIFRKNYMLMGEEFTLEQFYDRPVNKALIEEVTAYLRDKVDQLRLQLNEILAKKGKKHRKYTFERLQKIHQQYGDDAWKVVDHTYVMDVPQITEVTLQAE